MNVIHGPFNNDKKICIRLLFLPTKLSLKISSECIGNENLAKCQLENLIKVAGTHKFT